MPSLSFCTFVIVFAYGQGFEKTNDVFFDMSILLSLHLLTGSGQNGSC